MEIEVRPVEILLIEDNPGDVRLAREAIKNWASEVNLRVATDGGDALEELRGNGQRYPDLILLDLNLPRVSGREVLRELKASTELGHIPVIVLSTSDDELDINTAYALHANSYVVKPASLDRYMDVFVGLETYWLSLARIPSPVPH